MADMKGNAWLGGTNKTTGTYLWYPSNKTVLTDIWAPRQPDNYQSKENCIEVSVSRDGANDLPCDDQRLCICKSTREVENPTKFPSLVDDKNIKCSCSLKDVGAESPLCACHCYGVK